ncbi:MAG TPA: SAM-dependent methyltransferase [Caulobacteraceae bacterium]|nr:SAM-dependent methyltransferase [Caulobacteraceae bacterium]
MSLAERLKAEIAATGPITVADYMSRCLFDPMDGYYAVRPALGEDGDFITAPLVSQMFGELIGLWAVETWTRLGAPDRVLLVEVGPGDGTLMADMLRAVRLSPAFVAAAEVWLVEASEPLKARQRGRLAGGPLEPRWATELRDLPEGLPIVLVANELLDCLPCRQFLRTAQGWAERVVGIDEGRLAFGLRPAGRPAGAPADLPEGLAWEVSAAQRALGDAVGRRVAESGGVGLFIDYGRDTPGPGDTLQALQRHRKVDPLAEPGLADLTVWADFPGFLEAARGAGAATGPILSQGAFLRALGIEHRAAALAGARPEQADKLARQLARLVEPDQMGSLFKACAVWSPGSTAPPAFEETA